MKEQLAQIFEDTYNYCLSHNTLCRVTWECCRNTKLYKENDYPSIGSPRYTETEIIVNTDRTFESAQKFKDSKVGVLNFASALSPGGGVVWGSNAQEEALCRCSNLYFPLADKHANGLFYNPSSDYRFTDEVMYSPRVVVFKSDTLLPQLMDEGDWFKVDVLTCAAPNLKYEFMSDLELYGIHVKRGIHILTIAAANNIEILVLGAFGCGAFRNNPQVVAAAYHSVVKLFNGYFKQIVFSVYCSPKSSVNYETFRDEFQISR